MNRGLVASISLYVDILSILLFLFQWWSVF